MSGREGYWDGKRYIFRASLKADVELEWRSEVRRDSSTGGKELRFKSSVCMYHCICVYMHVCVCVCVCVCLKGSCSLRHFYDYSENAFKPVIQHVVLYYTGFGLACCSIHECVQASRSECDGLLQTHNRCPPGIVIHIPLYLYARKMVGTHFRWQTFQLRHSAMRNFQRSTGHW